MTAAKVDGYIAQRRGEGVTDSTIHKELTAWRRAMKLAKRANIWDGEIDRVFPIAFAPGYRPRERWMTPTEWLLLLADAEALEQPESRRADIVRSRLAILAIVAFMAATSAEWGAVLRARPEDVDVALWRVHIRGTKDAQKGGNRDRVVHVGHGYLLLFAMVYADGGRGAPLSDEGELPARPRRGLRADGHRPPLAERSPAHARPVASSRRRAACGSRPHHGSRGQPHGRAGLRQGLGR